MTTKELIERFVAGGTEGKASGGRLYIDGYKLINYGTCIAERHSMFLLNTSKYSPTTSKHQNYIRRYLDDCGMPYITIDEIKQGDKDLIL